MSAPALHLFAFSPPVVNRDVVSCVANFGSNSALLVGSSGIMCDLARAILSAAGQRAEPLTPRQVEPKPAAPKAPDRRTLKPERLKAYQEVRALGERGPHGTVAAELKRRGIAAPRYYSWLQRQTVSQREGGATQPGSAAARDRAKGEKSA